MIEKLFMTILISTSTFPLLFAQTSSEENNKVIVKDDKPHKSNDNNVQYKAISDKKQFYQEQKNLNQDQQGKQRKKKIAPMKDNNPVIKDEKDD